MHKKVSTIEIVAKHHSTCRCLIICASYFLSLFPSSISLYSDNLHFLFIFRCLEIAIRCVGIETKFWFQVFPPFETIIHLNRRFQFETISAEGLILPWNSCLVEQPKDSKFDRFKTKPNEIRQMDWIILWLKFNYIDFHLIIILSQINCSAIW